MLRLCFFTVTFLYLFSCTIKDKKPEAIPVVVDAYAAFYNQIREGKTMLKDGDLVVRSGNDFTSQLIKNFNKKDKTYSHSGLVFFNNGEPFIFHILSENPVANFAADTLEKFCNPRRNSGFAIYRYSIDSVETASLKSLVLKWHQQGIKFDSTFNLATDDQMYCSEMISKALSKATKNRIKIETIRASKTEALVASTHLSLTPEYISKLDLIPLDNLYINPHCRLVKRFDFNPQK